MSSTPFLVTRQVAPGLTTFSVPFLRFNKIKFGGRSTLIQLSSGALAIFSPTQLTPEVSGAIANLGGNVAYIICPDIEHHMQLTAYKAAFPAARVLAPQGLRDKRAKAGETDVFIDYEFSAANKRSLALPDELTRDLDVEYWDAHANREISFLHKPSRTLIEADVLFNLPAREQYSKTGESATSGLWTRLFMHMGTVQGRGQQRFLWYVLCKNKPRFAESAQRVAAWDFDRIIPCHGDVIETGGNNIFRRVFAWHLK